MDPITLAAAASSAVVSAMATDTWQSVRSAVVGLWQRHQESGAETVAAELAQTREDALAASEAGEEETRAELTALWRRQFRRFLDAHPELLPEVERVLNEDIKPALSPEDRAAADNITISTNVHDHGKANVLGKGTQINN
ncbi:hypothetical protein OHS17_32430 [Streptomyces sp. NBC_00523]|uniref:hypothetical protein n=1 Tax=Streptomyces sp. NBC_00523 TaxID=2975765 RepID=UPI002E8238E0|nr:hypothetical protein [Streptomyces sp. NBC_00523]WUD04070.1 hypothetical protein OHS17_32430 [Streptomyces sp. NBC_00523]